MDRSIAVEWLNYWTAERLIHWFIDSLVHSFTRRYSRYLVEWSGEFTNKYLSHMYTLCVYIYVCTYVYIHIHMHVCIYIYIYICVWEREYINRCIIYIYMHYVYIYICILCWRPLPILIFLCPNPQQIRVQNPTSEPIVWQYLECLDTHVQSSTLSHPALGGAIIELVFE